MPRMKEPLRVLVISKSIKMTELLRETLPGNQYKTISSASTVGEAKRILINQDFDIIVINTPLADDFGMQTAIDLSIEKSSGILILVKNELYDEISYRVEDYGIVTLAKPTSKQSLYSAIKMLGAMRIRMHALEKETVTLRSKMDEIRLITRAKWVLIDQLNMTEPQAHRHIEKQAMDRCVKKSEIAQNIIRTYER